jgi:hypothetical protein
MNDYSQHLDSIKELSEKAGELPTLRDILDFQVAIASALKAGFASVESKMEGVALGLAELQDDLDSIRSRQRARDFTQTSFFGQVDAGMVPSGTSFIGGGKRYQSFVSQ